MVNQMINGDKGYAVATLQDYKKGLRNVTETLKTNVGGEFLVLSKSGNWVAGQAKTKIDPKTRWAMNIPSLQHGWTCWERGDDADTSKGPIAEIMVSLWTPLPAEGSLQEHGYPWTQQVSVELTGVGGVDNGRKLIYKTNSKGGVARMRDLFNLIADQSTDSAPVPLLQFSHDSYNHKRWGETLTPIYTIVGWTDLLGEDLADEDGVVEDDRTQPAPVTAPVLDNDDEEEKLFRALEAKRAAKLAATKAAAPAEAGAPVRRRTR